MSRTLWRSTTRRFAGAIALALVLPILPIGMQAAGARTPPATSASSSTARTTTSPSGSRPSGSAPPSFTLEIWFKRTDRAARTRYRAPAIWWTDRTPSRCSPRVGRRARSPANLNMNYFLGIDTKAQRHSPTTGSPSTSRTRLSGVEPPVHRDHRRHSNVWHHAAATYDGSAVAASTSTESSTARALASVATPESTSIQHAATRHRVWTPAGAAGRVLRRPARRGAHLEHCSLAGADPIHDE